MSALLTYSVHRWVLSSQAGDEDGSQAVPAPKGTTASSKFLNKFIEYNVVGKLWVDQGRTVHGNLLFPLVFQGWDFSKSVA